MVAKQGLKLPMFFFFLVSPCVTKVQETKNFRRLQNQDPTSKLTIGHKVSSLHSLGNKSKRTKGEKIVIPKNQTGKVKLGGEDDEH